MHPSEAKRELRRSIEERLAHLSNAARLRESRTLCRCLLEALPHDRAVCAYSALPTEADISLLLEELNKRGTAVYLPCVEKSGLTFRRSDPSAELKPGPFRIPEPPKEAEALDLSCQMIVLVPGRAFDREGHRLGRGNGGYDRWIASVRGINPAARMWGVALECQLVESVPTEEHDQTMDAVFTARGVVMGEP
ncbi:MAG: 5-formyltetrahydrofolate cyclo-ligase [Candidatus Peregrinibacteria bacterium]